MSHQPYEYFLFTKEPLNAEQQHQLNLHLQECEYCNALTGALADLEEVFINSSAPEPAPGFTIRWQARLKENHDKQQRRKLWFMTIGLFALAALMLLFIFLYHLQYINIAYELSHLIARVSRFAAEVRFSVKMFHSITSTLPFVIPIILFLSASTLLAITVLTLTWLRAIIRLYSPIQERGNL